MLAVFLLSNVTGCNTKNASNVSKGKDNNSTEAIGYPISKEPITLRYWLPMHAAATQYIQSYAENEVYQEMEKVTGIKVDELRLY
jgi:putative aldouronate transport system substrate-binding protein